MSAATPILEHLRNFLPADRQPPDEVLVRTASHAFQAIELNIERSIENAFDGRDAELAVILTLIVAAVLYPEPSCPKDVRLTAANVLMEPFKAKRGAAH